MTELLALLRNTKELEIDCDEFWEKGPSLAEGVAELSGDDLQRYLYHLKMCSGCLENFEILKEMLKD
jgi:hypothetical protein